LQKYLTDMRAHMPPSHRAFLCGLEAGPSVRSAIYDLTGTLGSSSSIDSDSSLQGPFIDNSSSSSGGGSSSSLVEAYDEAVYQLEQFRAQHRGFAAKYIAQWSKKETTGTGGSDFMPALTGFKQTTASFRLQR
jgi:indoleamine 2,3-dioxygenase